MQVHSYAKFLVHCQRVLTHQKKHLYWSVTTSCDMYHSLQMSCKKRSLEGGYKRMTFYINCVPFAAE